MTARAAWSGTGAAALRALDGAAVQGDVTFVALHDERAGRAQRAAEARSIPRWTEDFRDMLSTGVDFVVLTGPLDARLGQVQLAAEQGASCLLHAPAAPDHATMQAMVAIAAEHEVRIGVYTRYHADPVIEQLRRMIANDWMGGVTAVQAINGDDALLRAGEVEHHANPFVALASAHVHLATWLTGRSARSVTAQTTRSYSPQLHDSGVATLVLNGDTSCTFSASQLTQADAFAIHGTDGGLRIAGDRIWLCGHRPFHGHVFDYDTAGTELVLARQELQRSLAAQQGTSELHGRFARWLDDTDDFPTPGEQAVIDFQVVDAMAHAAALGVRVDL
jgi:predicted dehydrogenase